MADDGWTERRPFGLGALVSSGQRGLCLVVELFCGGRGGLEGAWTAERCSMKEGGCRVEQRGCMQLRYLGGGRSSTGADELDLISEGLVGRYCRCRRVERGRYSSPEFAGVIDL